MLHMTTRLTEPQFDALIALTSIRRDSATCSALHQHLVLGYTKTAVCTSADISKQALDTALRRLRDADAAARAYAELLTPQPD